MIIDIEQTSKELFTATFNIIYNHGIIGGLRVQGSNHSMEADVEGSIWNKSFSISYGKVKECEIDKVFRPYILSENGKLFAALGQTKTKLGIFKSIDFHQLKLSDGSELNAYPIAMGEDGCKTPIYNSDVQIAQIENPSTIYNDMHNYKIFAIDENAAKFATYLAVYMYIQTGFKPGEKHIESKVTYYGVEKDKAVLEKYNPDFCTKINEI